MAVEADSGLLTPAPTKVAPAHLTIAHLQLRDLLICPQRAGLLNYVDNGRIIEHDLYGIATPRTIVALDWTPNTLACHALPDSDEFLLAAGGQNSELHLSLHRADPLGARCTQTRWADSSRRIGGSINNAVAFSSALNGPASSLSMGKPADSVVEPTLVVNNNDSTVSLFDVAVRRADKALGRLHARGKVIFSTPINHSSISPDGRTLLSVGDSSAIYLHALPGALLPVHTHAGESASTHAPRPVLTLEMPAAPPAFAARGPPASFATAFSGSGAKFAVGGQDGVLAVWDVRSSAPLRVLLPGDAPRPRGTAGTGAASGWLHDVHADLGNANAPAWGVRSVKFGRAAGAEVLLFAEHAGRVHALDARTFDAHDVYAMPAPSGPPPRRRRLSLASVDSADEGLGAPDIPAPWAAEPDEDEEPPEPPPPSARDLAGCCFSPDGARVYAASEYTVAEWGVRGAGRWWERDEEEGVLA